MMENGSPACPVRSCIRFHGIAPPIYNFRIKTLQHLFTDLTQINSDTYEASLFFWGGGDFSRERKLNDEILYIDKALHFSNITETLSLETWNKMSQSICFSLI